MLRFLDAYGALLDMPMNEESEAWPLTSDGLVHLRGGHPWVAIVPGEEERTLVYHQPVVAGSEVIGIVQVSRSLADRDRSLRALGTALILGSSLTTVVAFGVGWGLAGVTLRPIQRITQTALEIGQERDFGSRVQHEGPNDELGRLATTFNGMLSRLQDAYQQVAHALQAQRDFVADVSHELRTPLTTIRGNLALLQRRPPPSVHDREDILDDLGGESERLIRLVGDLLTLARADAGRKLARDPIPVWPLVDDICRQARLLEPGREIVCEGAEDAVAVGDPDTLKQVILILLDNAIKHGEGSVRVHLAARDHVVAEHPVRIRAPGAGAPGWVAIRVQDSGPGMPPELGERIFDRFYRGDASRSTPGFGLGLSIARALVEAQGGTVKMESEVGVGTTFTVTLPSTDDGRESRERGAVP
jgi:signal transduction histidine kinase